MTSPELQGLLDRDAIRAVVYRVCRAMDRADHDLFLSCYHDDAWDDHGYYKGPVADFKPASIFRPEHVKSLAHNMTNILIEMEGDAAWSEGYFVAIQRMEQDCTLQDVTFTGRYYDKFERRAGAWKIAERLTMIDTTRVDPVLKTLDIPGAVSGRASREDPTYRRWTGR